MTLLYLLLIIALAAVLLYVLTPDRVAAKIKSWFGVVEHDVGSIVSGIETMVQRLRAAENHHAEAAGIAAAAHTKALTERDRAGNVADKLSALVA